MRFAQWLQKAIQRQGRNSSHDWLECLSWATFLKTIQHLAEGGCLLICVDKERTWFKVYVLAHFNHHRLRPPIPIFDALGAFELTLSQENLDAQNMALITSTLDLSYQNYVFWYIGGLSTPLAQLALSQDHSFLWILDGTKSDAISLSSLDPMLDCKLIQLYQIFENLLFDALLGRVELL